ncbi:hypothetical protein [Pedobacter hiemivivus]|uniref:Uncharacterized protein n=1 Tax=Pedobacter hiemivivus TaxID=2530454 RepID=A0A4R0NG75_9SPHI|nr:hypothetical protein [Pedobacter hiemivivus]TCC97704.1 hypothetical protein EZ444_07250 [Pedobacter hiemivivus]
MSYNIPLLSIGQDGYQIPISLNYNASGIKLSTKVDIAGLGWSLNYGGGIVNRNIRGGFADEDRTYGILLNPIPTDPTALLAHEAKVGKGKVDGESDIFSVNINGVAIKFVITLEAGKLVVNPLERTDIVIECLSDSFYYIHGFKITDTQGTVYTFQSGDPSNSYIKSPADGNSSLISAVTFWYLTKISVINNGDINFEYTNSYLEEKDNAGFSYVQYGMPMLSPKLNNDGALNAQLESLNNNYGNSSAQLNFVRNQLQNANSTLTSLKQSLYISQYTDSLGNFSSMNQSVWNSYMNQFNMLVGEFSNLYLENNQYIGDLKGVLSQMYGLNDEKKFEISGYRHNTLFSNKLIKRIITRTDIVDFSYVEKNSSNKQNYLISKIEHKTIAGELLKTYLFDVQSDMGFLKKVMVFTPTGKAEQQYDFDYYHETLNVSSPSTDYWGYYNGKWSMARFSLDLAYGSYYSGSAASVFSKNQNFLRSDFSTNILPSVIPPEIPSDNYYADRNPVDSAAVYHSLKKVTNLLGGTISFKYEGNEIYHPQLNQNIPIGGIRIKSITTYDGSKEQTVSYKYKFPLLNNSTVLKSTGALTEWEKKTFAVPYFYQGGYDVHVFSDFVDMGTLYVDNSNNGVLYHYVEEVRSDGAATGYKYLQALATPSFEIESCQFIFHKLLTAKIDYDAAGKIVGIKKNTYGVNTPFSEYGWPTMGTFGSSIKSLPQLKKSIISYDEENLKQIYQNTEVAQINFEGSLYSINPYFRQYIPNYEPRVHSSERPIKYQLTTGYLSLLKEEETNIYNSDYNIPLGTSNSPVEKPDLYTWLLNSSGIKPVQSIITYNYGNPAHLNPTEIRTTSSNGDVLTKKIKYAADYQLPAENPISMLKNQGRQATVIEEQLWKSIDVGASFRLVSGTINEYVSRIVKGKTYLLPEKEYRLNVVAPLSPGAQGYVQSLNTNAPYTTVFWETNQLYGAPIHLKLWDEGSNFLRMSGGKGRTGNNLKAVKYDPFNGDLLLEAENVDPKNLLAFDSSPYQRHEYYDKYKLFQKYYGPSYKENVRFSDAPFFNNRREIFLSINHRFYALGIDSAMLNFQINYPQMYFTYMQNPTFRALNNLVFMMANINSMNGFIKAYVEYKKAKNLMPSEEFLVMSGTLTDYGFNYFEVNAYLDILGNFFYADFEYYDILFNDSATAVVVPMAKQDLPVSHIPLSIDVDNLISTNVNLDLYASRVGSRVGNKYAYRIKYKNNTYSPLETIVLPSSDNIVKSKLILSTLTNASQIKSIEFLFGYEQELYNLGLFLAVPENTLFKATGYLPNHTPYISFDQSKRYTETFYDEKMNRHFIKDLNNSVVQVEKLVYSKIGAEMPKKTRVTIQNTYYEYAPAQCNIESVTFFNTATSELIRRDALIIPGYNQSFELSPGNYNIYLNTDAPIGTVWFGSQKIITNATGANVMETFSANQNYSITVGP